MKTILQLILAGVIGGAIAFGAFKMFDKDTVIYETTPVQVVKTPVSNSTSIDFSTDFVSAADRANPAVVHISAKNEEYLAYSQNGARRQYDPYEDFWGFRRRRQGDRPQAGTGSGVLVSTDGMIITNNHVVGFADFLEVTTSDGTRYEARKIGTDPSSDLAIIQIEGNNFPHLEFADSDDVKVGEWVVAVGNPFNLTSTVTAGIVSAIGRDLDIIQGFKAIEEFIQTDAVVNPGNSGGALVNVKGELIGINTAISSPTGVYAGYSFAIPANLVRRVMADIIEVGGDVQRTMLGITIANIEDAKREGLETYAESGVFVTGFPDRVYSSAKYSGMEVGDVITGVDGSQVREPEDLLEAVRYIKVGDTINVEVNRKGKKKTIPVKLRRGI
ncbi:MAG: trypsin-like peptidase domain-containing protein [Bacteroidota bacterium]